MATNNEEVFDAFVRIWSDRWSVVPTGLARQEPSVVARLLKLGSREGGISQSDAQRELRMNQPRLSKLIKKLIRVGWIRVNRSKTDRRIRLMTTTVTAQAWIASLKQDLETLVRAQGRATAPKSRPSSAVRRQIEQQQVSQGFVFDE
jgi:DNA-binding MarR family transcriptional regulator